MKRDIVVSRLTVTPDVAQHLFAQLCLAGLPIDFSVPFLVRARGWRLADFCAELDIHRGYFSALLKGQYVTSMTVRLGVRQRLGFDPWRAVGDSTATIGALDQSSHPGDYDRPQHEGAVR